MWRHQSLSQSLTGSSFTARLCLEVFCVQLVPDPRCGDADHCHYKSKLPMICTVLRSSCFLTLSVRNLGTFSLPLPPQTRVGGLLLQESKTCLLLSFATSALPPAVLSAGSDWSRLSAAGVLERPVPCGSSTGSTVQHWQQQEQRGAWEPLSNSSWQSGAGKPSICRSPEWCWQT